MPVTPRPARPARALSLFAWLVVAAVLLAACSEPQQPTVNLYRAIHAGDLDQVKRHLHWGTDVDSPDADGEYPLHVAVRRGREVIARELIRHGARLDVRDRSGHTPLYVALAEGKTQIAQALFAAAPTEDAQGLLFALVEAGVADRDSLALLLRQGARLDAQNADGAAALHIAAATGGPALVRRLIEAGADVNQVDGQGRTPLAVALARGDRDIAALLRRYGAAEAPLGRS